MHTIRKTYRTDTVRLVLTLDDIKKLLNDSGIEVTADASIYLMTESNSGDDQQHKALNSGVYRVVFCVERPCRVEGV